MDSGLCLTQPDTQTLIYREFFTYHLIKLARNVAVYLNANDLVGDK